MNNKNNHIDACMVAEIHFIETPTEEPAPGEIAKKEVNVDRHGVAYVETRSFPNREGQEPIQTKSLWAYRDPDDYFGLFVDLVVGCYLPDAIDAEETCGGSSERQCHIDVIYDGGDKVSYDLTRLTAEEFLSAFAQAFPDKADYPGKADRDGPSFLVRPLEENKEEA